MSNIKIKLPKYEKSDSYTLSYHISALSDKRYRLALTDQNGRVLAEITHNTDQFEGCLGMDKIFINSRETEIYLEVESSGESIKVHENHNFSKDGASELYSAFFSDNNDLNFHALVIHIVFAKNVLSEVAI